MLQELKLVSLLLLGVDLSNKTAQNSDLLLEIVLKVKIELGAEFDVSVVVVKGLLGDVDYLGSLLQSYLGVLVGDFPPF